MLLLILAVVATFAAVDVTRRIGRHRPVGMTASMAAMMAAMGSGLSIGYAAGLIATLGWATLAGVLAGSMHGLWMGRRYGPMAALEGFGGGVMGGLMGPMLAVMLLYLPTDLLLAGVLLLALQLALNAGALYLAVEAAGAAPTTGWLRFVGRLLGADAAAACEPCEEPSQPVPTARRGRSAPVAPVRSVPAAGPAGASAANRRSSLLGGAVLVGGALAVVFAVDRAITAQQPAGASGQGGDENGFGLGKPVVADAGPDGVQQVAMKLRAPQYEPKLVQVKQGVPVKLTLEAIGDPG